MMTVAISGSMMLAIAVLVSLVKPFLETWFLPATVPLHDHVVRLLAIVVGCLLEVISLVVGLPPHALLAPSSLWVAMQNGAMDGLGAIASYHLLTANFWTTTALAQTAAPLRYFDPHGTQGVPAPAGMGDTALAPPMVGASPIVPSPVPGIDHGPPTSGG